MKNGELSWHDRGRLWIRLGIRLVLLLLILLSLRYLAPPLFGLFMPFIVAIIVAWLLNPLVKTLQKKLGISRGILSLAIILLVFAVVGGVLTALVYSIFNEVRALAENWHTIWDSTQVLIQSSVDVLDKLLGRLPATVLDSVNTYLTQFADWLQNVIPTFLTSIAGRAGTFAMSVPAFAVASIIFVMATYFIMADYPHIRFMATARMSAGVKEVLSHVRRTALGAFGGYVRAEFILSIGVFFILLVGFVLIRQSYSVLLALLLSVLDFIPILGAGTVMIPWAVLDLLSGNWAHAVGLMAVWGIIALFRRVAEPKVVGSQTGLSPILSLVSIYVGMKLGGVMGMILGPIVCLVIINTCKTGLFDATLADFHLAAADTAALLKNRPEPTDTDSAP